MVINVDAPAPNQTVGQPFVVTGWAIDRAHPTQSGVSFLHVWATPHSGAPAVFLGQADTGYARPDIGAYYGSRFTPSGWGLTASGLSPGWHTLTFTPFSTVTQTFRFDKVVNVVVLVQ